MTTLAVNIVPLTVPTSVSLDVTVSPLTVGYDERGASVLISTLDTATRQALIDEFAASLLAL